MEKRQLNTVVEIGGEKLKILFSHQNKRVHSAIVPVLKEFLSHELGREVEVISRYTAWETLYSATDNVFDLIILADSYQAADLSSTELVKQIKKLDQSIPVVRVFNHGHETKEQADASIRLPKTRSELRPLTHFFRGGERYRKRG